MVVYPLHSVIKNTRVHIFTWFQWNCIFWVVFCFLLWKVFLVTVVFTRSQTPGLLLLSHSRGERFMGFFSLCLFFFFSFWLVTYVLVLRSTQKLNSSHSETSKAKRRPPDQNHVDAVLSTGQPLPKVSTTSVSLGWAKSNTFEPREHLLKAWRPTEQTWQESLIIIRHEMDKMLNTDKGQHPQRW